MIVSTDEHLFCCDRDIVNLAQDDLRHLTVMLRVMLRHEGTSLHLILLVILEMLRRLIVIYQKLRHWRCTSEV